MIQCYGEVSVIKSGLMTPNTRTEGIRSLRGSGEEYMSGKDLCVCVCVLCQLVCVCVREGKRDRKRYK